MGYSWVEIEVSNMERTKSRRLKALVDMGASLTVLPGSVAEELGIEPIREEDVATGAGLVKIKRGRGWIKLYDKEAIFDVWISDIIDKVLLGVVVLKVLGYEVDPVTGRLRERPLLLY
ncbi:MAG: aspartyl protease family protein [Candidatus Bathyarchaeia archaeon]